MSYRQEIEKRRKCAVWITGSLEKLFFNADRFAQVQGVGSVNLRYAVEQIAVKVKCEPGNDEVIKGIR